MTELIISIAKLLLVIFQVYWYKAKLKVEKQMIYKKQVETQLLLCTQAMQRIQGNAVQDWKSMDVDDDQDEDLKPHRNSST